MAALTPELLDEGLESQVGAQKDEHISGASATRTLTTQSISQHPQSLSAEIPFVLILCMAQLFTQAGLGQSIAPLHIIGDSFGTTAPGQLSWFPAAYSLTVGTFILIAGRLGDLIGHKRLIIAGFLWFGLWSLLAGFSVYSSIIFFDCCRAFQGIGAAFLLPNAVAILGRTYGPGMRKQMVFSIFGAMAPTGFLVGALFGSLFAQLVWWPWTFWVTAIISLLLAAGSIFAIPNAAISKLDPSVGILTRSDAAGSLTGVVGLVLVNFSWNQAPVVGWSTPYVYIILIIGFVFLAAFAYIETTAEYPLVPFRDLSADIAFLLACVACGWGAFSLWIYYFWQFLEELRNISPLLAAAQFSPVVISGACAALCTGFIIHRVDGSVVMICALTAFLVGVILVATAPVEQTYWAQTFVSLLIMPWGMDMSFPAATLLMSHAMPKEHQGVAASLVMTVINYSISLALGFAGTIEVHVNDNGANLLKGYRGAWYLGIGLAGLGLGISACYGLSSWRRSRKRTTQG